MPEGRRPERKQERRTLRERIVTWWRLKREKPERFRHEHFVGALRKEFSETVSREEFKRLKNALVYFWWGAKFEKEALERFKSQPSKEELKEFIEAEADRIKLALDNSKGEERKRLSVLFLEFVRTYLEPGKISEYGVDELLRGLGPNRKIFTEFLEKRNSQLAMLQLRRGSAEFKKDVENLLGSGKSGDPFDFVSEELPEVAQIKEALNRRQGIAMEELDDPFTVDQILIQELLNAALQDQEKRKEIMGIVKRNRQKRRGEYF